MAQRKEKGETVPYVPHSGIRTANSEKNTLFYGSRLRLLSPPKRRCGASLIKGSPPEVLLHWVFRRFPRFSKKWEKWMKCRTADREVRKSMNSASVLVGGAVQGAPFGPSPYKSHGFGLLLPLQGCIKLQMRRGARVLKWLKGATISALRARRPRGCP